MVCVDAALSIIERHPHTNTPTSDASLDQLPADALPAVTALLAVAAREASAGRWWQVASLDVFASEARQDHRAWINYMHRGIQWLGHGSLSDGLDAVTKGGGLSVHDRQVLESTVRAGAFSSDLGRGRAGVGTRGGQFDNGPSALATRIIGRLETGRCSEPKDTVACYDSLQAVCQAVIGLGASSPSV